MVAVVARKEEGKRSAHGIAVAVIVFAMNYYSDLDPENCTGAIRLARPELIAAGRLSTTSIIPRARSEQ